MRYVLPVLLVVVAAGAASVAIDRVDVPPRRLGPWVERRAEGHHGILERGGRELSAVLVALDRGRTAFHAPLPVPAGAIGEPPAAKRRVIVASTEEALRAIDDARPGDDITFVPGTYRFDGAYIDAHEAGAPGAPITVSADEPHSVVLEFNMIEGFLVRAPYWSFTNLTIRGVCSEHSNCEHAFHVIGTAGHFVARQNEIVDFNAHFKINGMRGSYPDWGLIEGNVIRNTGPRETANPVTPVDLVGASHWRIRGNRISDFVKRRGDGTSYGAFVKGGGSDNRLEDNVVVCEDRLRGFPGQRVGLSLGGGGSSRDACRDGRCITEQDEGVIASNLIASCSDDGIYLNRAATSVITHNTLIDTAGITARFGESAAAVEGNLIDGPIRAVDGALLHQTDNRITSVAVLYLGLHPVRDLFVDAPTLDLRWRSDAPRRQRAASQSPDLCGTPRPARPAYGAFEDIARCTVSGN
jgi:hypothetical protein